MPDNPQPPPPEAILPDVNQPFGTGLQGDDTQGTDLQGGPAVVLAVPQARLQLIFGARKLGIPWS